jgi:hypothetical protein
MAVIAIPRALRESLGDEGTDALTVVIKEIDIEARKDAIAIAEERFERRLTEEISKVNERITHEISKINQRLTEEISGVRVEIEKSKSEILKWMFIFWIGQIGVLSGIIFAMLRFYFKMN